MEHDEGKIDKMVRVCVRGRDKIGLLWSASTKPVILPIHKTRPSL